MRALHLTLVGIAAAISTTAGCVSSSSTTAEGDRPGAGDAGAPADGGDGADGGEAGPGPVACGGCNCPQPKTTSASASPAQACAIAGDMNFAAGACEAFCGALPGNANLGGLYCTLPADYQKTYAAVADAGTDAGDSDGGTVCPTWSDDVVVQCGVACLGRRTAGIAEPVSSGAPSLGETFATRAYLEAVAVHAFVRLERELAFHGAPASLLRQARRARRDEVRHTTMSVKLARRFGAEPALPKAPSATPPRSLFEIARENAVEGCVRETYGAVIGLLEARASSDAVVRRASSRIAMDECRHAELARDIARWIDARLTSEERASVRRAAADAIEELRTRGDARIVARLLEEVWESQAA